MHHWMKAQVYTPGHTSGKHFRCAAKRSTVRLPEYRPKEPQNCQMEADLRVQIRFRGAASLSAVLLLFVCLLLPYRLAAQIDTGGITGTVHDSAGAVVVGARVTLTNEATGVKTTVQSTSSGTYV